MGFKEPTGHPFVGLTFTSWKEVTNAVQCAALQENKQVSCTSALSGRHKKVYKCVHWLGCLKRHKQRILDLACDKYPADEHMRGEFINLNPFGGQGACNYSVVALWNQSKGFHISTTMSNLSHNRYYTVMHGFASYNINLMMYASYNIQFISHCNSWFFQTRHCTVVGGRVTASMLMSDASFSGTVSNHGGKGLVSVLRKEAGKLGYGGNAARSDVFWRVNAKGMAQRTTCM
jgi:hypothetical protein